MKCFCNSFTVLCVVAGFGEEGLYIDDWDGEGAEESGDFECSHHGVFVYKEFIISSIFNSDIS